MGRQKSAMKLCRDSSCSDSSSDSSDDEPQLLLHRYQAADIAFGLGQRALRMAALLELQEIFDQGLYSDSDKKVQQAIFDDMLVAAQQRDSRARVKQAISALLSTAKRVLPQKQRQQLAKVEKQAAVAASRAARKESGVASSSSEGACSGSDDDCHVVFSDVPLEVVSVILQSLDPVSLATAACVCRSWHQLATSDSLWRSHLQVAYPATSSRFRTQHQLTHPPLPLVPGLPQQLRQQLDCAGGDGACDSGGGGGGGSCSSIQQPDKMYALFSRKARKHPTALLPWKSCRALAVTVNPTGFDLQWCLPASEGHNSSAYDAHIVGGAALCAIKKASAGSPPKLRLTFSTSATAAPAAAAIQAGRVLPQQYAGPPVFGQPTPLTPAQAVRWMMGFRGRAVYGDCESDSDASGSDSSSSSSDDDSDGDESHTAAASAQRALRLWSIGKQ